MMNCRYHKCLESNKDLGYLQRSMGNKINREGNLQMHIEALITKSKENENKILFWRENEILGHDIY